MCGHIKIYLILSIVFGTLSCQNHRPGHSGKLLAAVGSSRFYESDLNINLSGNKDSAAIKANLIKDWVKKQLVFKKAIESLSDAEKNKDKELKDYYESLVSYEYIDKMAFENVDTSVSENEMMQYYHDNQKNFETKRNNTGLLNVKVPVETDTEVLNYSIASYLTVKDRIRAIILNRRKTILMKQAENQIYRDGESRKLFEIYNNPQKK